MLRLENRLNNIDEVATLSKLQDVNTDLITMICGEKIGSGAYRSVYEYNFNPNKMVVKIEPYSTDSNINEYQIWYEVQGLCGDLSWVKEWFAPIHYCSPNGKIIIMERTRQLDKPLPEKVPWFFTDVKIDNFGWIGNRFVCHDYGFIHSFMKYDKKFKKAIWT